MVITRQFEPAEFHVLSSHTWVMAAVLDSEFLYSILHPAGWIKFLKCKCHQLWIFKNMSIPGSPLLSKWTPPLAFVIGFQLTFLDCLFVISSCMEPPASGNILAFPPNTSLFSRSLCLCADGFLYMERHSFSFCFFISKLLFQEDPIETPSPFKTF